MFDIPPKCPALADKITGLFGWRHTYRVHHKQKGIPHTSYLHKSYSLTLPRKSVCFCFFFPYEMLKIFKHLFIMTAFFCVSIKFLSKYCSKCFDCYVVGVGVLKRDKISLARAHDQLLKKCILGIAFIVLLFVNCFLYNINYGCGFVRFL